MRPRRKGIRELSDADRDALVRAYAIQYDPEWTQLITFAMETLQKLVNKTHVAINVEAYMKEVFSKVSK